MTAADTVLRVEEEQIQEVAERQPPRLRVVEVRRGELLGRRACRRILILVEEQRDAELLADAAVHLGEAHLQHHLLALAAARHLQHVDDLALRGGRLRDLAGAQHDARARHLAGQNGRFLAGAHLDVFAGEQRLQVAAAAVVTARLDDDVVLQRGRPGPR